MKRKIRVAIAGNPNVGKTALMNALAGTNEKIGNWPGVTVQKKVGAYNFRGFEIELIDLPGIYSLTSYTLEEKVARSFLLKKDYDVVLNVIDATLLGRNLYLTLELLEMGIKPIIALNKVDEIEQSGFKIDAKKLEQILHLPVIPISATKKKGLEELSETILRVATGDLTLKGFEPRYSKDLENAIMLITYRLESVLLEENLPFPLRWLAIKLLEQDPEIIEQLDKYVADPEIILKELEEIEEVIQQRHRCDLPSFVAKERFHLASEIAKKAITKTKPTAALTISDRIDKIVTNPLTGIPIFFLIMWLVFKLTFSISAPFTDLIDYFFGQFLPDLVETKFNFLPHFLISLLDDGVFAGVGAVLMFLPILSVLFFLMSILEDTGYMARAAALWDNFMKLFGLSGASVIPMILGFGCNVPAVYATRAMRSPTQKLITMMVIPWISCSARLPVYAVFTAAFFKNYQSLVIFGLYLTGVLFALAFAFIVSKKLKTTEEEFFIELPSYKLPAWNVVLNQTYIEVREFVQKAGTVIFALSVFIWLIASLPPGTDYASPESLVGHLGKALQPIFEPIGIHDWKPIVALIFGALAKEVVVGTLGTLYGVEHSISQALSNTFTPASALSYMVFVLLYIPCVATIAAIKQESGSWKYPAILIVTELTVAWIAAFSVYHVAKVFLNG
ncbi:ferrous iron transport protein B [Desulfurobacterium pacificum]|uniref:Ferrous iron transport protein B n=1 Tax=Desulfurobacterium pacificum TaxID=240166 RepID=A0ABY1NDZ1_9BACT|nr:ferrous iron transport protein B [Desulfurobacterium pacificum]SMP07238.1 ferrous iron transport protein B [Desulfurobacterium pacificum]